LKIKWEYEKEGYQFDDGTRYLPDFWLPEQNCFIEIKPVRATVDEEEKATNLAREKKCNIFILSGNIPSVDELDDWAGLDFIGWSSNESCVGYDYYYKFCECRKCGRIGIEYDGRSERIDCECDTGHKTYNYFSFKLIDAYIKARSARFEFGESG